MSGLERLVREELSEPVELQVADMAAALAAQYPEAARAVLFYGSCLRERQLQGLMLDFYLIVSDYRDAYGKSWLARANRLIPPNVFPFTHGSLSAKYAVLSEADFDRLNGPEPLSVSVWARFAQPARLVWSADDAATERAVAAVSRAAPTLLAAAAPMMDERIVEPLALWRQAFALTYSAELRAERKARASSVVDSDPGRYRRFSAPAIAAAKLGRIEADGLLHLPPLSAADRARSGALWGKRRRAGKMLSVVRLGKATGTYAGGSIISPGRSTATPARRSRSSPGSGAGRSLQPLLCCLAC
jgi:hypothetical protein